MGKDSGQSSEFKGSFLALLALDVASAIDRRLEHDDQASRRDLVRTAFAAVEGTAWMFREHISSVAAELDVITFEERFALSEMSYQVSKGGKVIGQPKYLPLPAAIRLSARLAMRLSTDLDIRFDDGNWDKFHKAADIRNRITHPKNQVDLAIGEEDMAVVLTAFFWVLEVAMRAMESSNTALKAYVTQARIILEALKRGDPDVVFEYRNAAKYLEDREY